MKSQETHHTQHKGQINALDYFFNPSKYSNQQWNIESKDAITGIIDVKGSFLFRNCNMEDVEANDGTLQKNLEEEYEEHFQKDQDDKEEKSESSQVKNKEQENKQQDEEHKQQEKQQEDEDQVDIDKDTKSKQKQNQSFSQSKHDDQQQHKQKNEDHLQNRLQGNYMPSLIMKTNQFYLSPGQIEQQTQINSQSIPQNLEVNPYLTDQQIAKMKELQPTLNQLQKNFNDITSNIDEQTHSVKDLNKKSKISTIPPPISHSSNLISSSSLIDINKSSKLQSQGSFSSNSSSIPRLKQQKDKRPLHSKESENLLQNFAQQAYLNHNINNSKLGLSEKLQQHGRRKEDDQRKKSIEILGREQREKKKVVLAKIRNMHLPCEEIRQLINVDDELLMNQTFEQFNNAMQDF